MRLLHIALMGLILTGCAAQRGFPPTHGINNFDQVDDKLFRGAQPTEEGLAELKNLGITQVISLRQLTDEAPYEQEVCDKLGIVYHLVPLSPLAAPPDRHIEHAMRLIESEPGKTFVHCQFGADRTSVVCACWRIRHHHWLPELAQREADMYGMSHMELGMRHFIKHYP